MTIKTFLLAILLYGLSPIVASAADKDLVSASSDSALSGKERNLDSWVGKFSQRDDAIVAYNARYPDRMRKNPAKYRRDMDKLRSHFDFVELEMLVGALQDTSLTTLIKKQIVQFFARGTYDAESRRKHLEGAAIYHANLFVEKIAALENDAAKENKTELQTQDLLNRVREIREKIQLPYEIAGILLSLKQLANGSRQNSFRLMPEYPTATHSKFAEINEKGLDYLQNMARKLAPIDAFSQQEMAVKIISGQGEAEVIEVINEKMQKEEGFPLIPSAEPYESLDSDLTRPLLESTQAKREAENFRNFNSTIDNLKSRFPWNEIIDIDGRYLSNIEEDRIAELLPIVQRIYQKNFDVKNYREHFLTQKVVNSLNSKLKWYRRFCYFIYFPIATRIFLHANIVTPIAKKVKTVGEAIALGQNKRTFRKQVIARLEAWEGQAGNNEVSEADLLAADIIRMGTEYREEDGATLSEVRWLEILLSAQNHAKSRIAERDAATEKSNKLALAIQTYQEEEANYLERQEDDDLSVSVTEAARRLLSRADYLSKINGSFSSFRDKAINEFVRNNQNKNRYDELSTVGIVSLKKQIDACDTLVNSSMATASLLVRKIANLQRKEGSSLLMFEALSRQNAANEGLSRTGEPAKRNCYITERDSAQQICLLVRAEQLRILKWEENLRRLSSAVAKFWSDASLDAHNDNMIHMITAAEKKAATEMQVIESFRKDSAYLQYLRELKAKEADNEEQARQSFQGIGDTQQSMDNTLAMRPVTSNTRHNFESIYVALPLCMPKATQHKDSCFICHQKIPIEWIRYGQVEKKCDAVNASIVICVPKNAYMKGGNHDISAICGCPFHVPCLGDNRGIRCQCGAIMPFDQLDKEKREEIYGPWQDDDDDEDEIENDES